MIGKHLNPACYIPDAFSTAAYLAWRYAGDFDVGICAAAQAGSDSYHRGAMVGALLGEAVSVPVNWRDPLSAGQSPPLAV